MKFGIVGCSERARDVFGNAVSEKDVELYAICENNIDELNVSTEYFKNKGVKNLKAFTDYDEMLKDDKIQAVFIATYADNHASFAIKALNAGKHVLSEIPAFYTIQEAKQLKEAVKKHPELYYMIAENCCYWDFIKAWKTMAQDNLIGDAIYAEAEYIHSFPQEKKYPNNYWRSYFHPIQYSTHSLGPLLYILEDECINVSAFRVKTGDKVRDNCASALFKTKKGVVIRILICFSGYAGFDHNYRIIGTRGTVETDNTKALDQKHSFARFSDIPSTIDKKLDIPVSMSQDKTNLSHGGADKVMLLDFVDIVKNKKENIFNVDFAIKISLPGIIAAESCENDGKNLDIPEI